MASFSEPMFTIEDVCEPYQAPEPMFTREDVCEPYQAHIHRGRFSFPFLIPAEAGPSQELPNTKAFKYL